jgi:hypothetical protein
MLSVTRDAMTAETRSVRVRNTMARSLRRRLPHVRRAGAAPLCPAGHLPHRWGDRRWRWLPASWKACRAVYAEQRSCNRSKVSGLSCRCSIAESQRSLFGKTARPANLPTCGGDARQGRGGRPRHAGRQFAALRPSKRNAGSNHGRNWPRDGEHVPSAFMPFLYLRPLLRMDFLSPPAVAFHDQREGRCHARYHVAQFPAAPSAPGHAQPADA